jgi:hypothetical protein
MPTDKPLTAAGRPPKRLRAAGILAAGAIAGGALAGTISANAADSSSPAGRAGATTSSTPVRSDETTPSSSIVATLTSKAEAAVPGGIVYRVETDAGDAAYEAHVTKADGSLVTVKFDKSLAVIREEAGMGKGDPAPAGAPGPGSTP